MSLILFIQNWLPTLKISIAYVTLHYKSLVLAMNFGTQPLNCLITIMFHRSNEKIMNVANVRRFSPCKRIIAQPSWDHSALWYWRWFSNICTIFLLIYKIGSFRKLWLHRYFGQSRPLKYDMNLRNETIALNGIIILPLFLIYIYIYLFILFIYATFFGILLTRIISTKLCKCYGIKHASKNLAYWQC